MVDALLTETQACSFAELSLSPFFQRRWCSLYEAFEDGRIDQERLWLDRDATSIERLESETSPDRTVVSKPKPKPKKRRKRA